MTRQAKAHIVRELAKRILALGGDVPEPETLNDGDDSILALFSGILSLFERQHSGK